MNLSECQYTGDEAAIENVFSFLQSEYKYRLIEKSERKFLTKLIYRNLWRRRKIEITNATYPGDYGFSISIYNLWKNECNLIINNWIDGANFLENLEEVKDKIINNEMCMKWIKGNNWKLSRKVLIQ